MKKLLLLGLLFNQQGLAEGYYYPVPTNPPAFIYTLPPAYIVPPQQNYYVPPPFYTQPIQRGYMPPPPDGWANSKLVPLPPKVDLYKEGN